MDEISAEVLEQFAVWPRVLELGRAMMVVNPALRAEQTKVWKAEHPLKVRASLEKGRRTRGIGPRLKGAHDARSKPFVDQHGNRYACYTDAELRTGVRRGTIWRVLRGHRKSARGFEFRYESPPHLA